MDVSIHPLCSLESYQEFKLASAGFSSGSEYLDRWLHTYAWTNEEKGFSRTVLAISDESLVGYFELHAGMLEQSRVPRKNRHGSPREVPVVVLGQLAVRSDQHGNGLGGALLVEALGRAFQSSGRIGAAFILVQPLDDRARKFYKKYDFVELSGMESRQPLMALKVDTARQIVASN